MRKKPELLFFGLLLFTVGICIYGYLQERNFLEAIDLKKKQIEDLSKIVKENEKILITKNQLIELKSKMLLNQERQLEILNKKSNEVSYAGFTYGDKTISTEELLTLFNKTYKENEHNKFIISSIKKNFGISYNSINERVIQSEIDSNSVISKLELSNMEKLKVINKQVKELNDLYIKETALKLIEKTYNVTYKVNGKMVSIPDNRMDTLLMIYPLIKNRIRTSDRKIWIKGLL